ncbi:hypothetical protein [Kribbella flavida]|nr:hypothetical protein [Kribbella flavida]
MRFSVCLYDARARVAPGRAYAGDKAGAYDAAARVIARQRAPGR